MKKIYISKTDLNKAKLLFALITVASVLTLALTLGF
jgi:hypothetical protein